MIIRKILILDVIPFPKLTGLFVIRRYIHYPAKECINISIYRWVQYYAPKILDKLKWYWKPKLGFSWRVDESVPCKAA